jgi:hypothetical protein
MRADRAVAVALALVCAGCGSAGGHSSSSATSHGVSRPATSASAAPAAIGDVRGRLLPSRALRGFTPLGRRQVGTSAASWATVNQLPAGEATRLERVPGVPGARGYYAVGSGINAAFADGAFCYLVGAEEPPPGTPGGTSRASLVTAVQRLYRRVH